MKKPSTIIIFIFTLFVSSEIFANEFKDMEELSFRRTVSNTAVCGQMAYALGNKTTTNQLANRIVVTVGMRVCKTKKAAEFIACAQKRKYADWEDTSSTCNSFFSTTSKEEVRECMRTSVEYIKNFIYPIMNKRTDRIYKIANLSGEDKETAAKAFYAENCPY